MKLKQILKEMNHISQSGVETNMDPSDDDYNINYGKEGLVAKDTGNINMKEMVKPVGYQEMSDRTEADLDRLFKKLSPAQKNNPELLHAFLKDYFDGESIGDAHDWAAKSAAVRNGINPKIVSGVIFKIYKSAQGK